MNLAHPADEAPSLPPRPPGPPCHTHDDGTECIYVRHYGIDRWRQVGHLGVDQGPCPGFPPPEPENHTCGYPEDSFPCKIRHQHLQTGWAKADH